MIGQGCQGFFPREKMEDEAHTGRARGTRVLLLFVFLINVGKMAHAQTKAEQYIQLKETQVKLIASSAVDNAEVCDYLKTCQQSGYCSTAACLQTRSDVAGTNCVGVTNNLDCPCSAQARADYTQSYVRVPDAAKINEESVAAICIQQHLDSVFLSRNNKYVYDYDLKFYSFYLGTVDGAVRAFPGAAIKDCNGYDPRVRPWYMGAISVVKDLVVLVDASSFMSNVKDFADGDNRNQTTALAVARNMATQLLITLTQGDRVTVMAYYSDGLLSLNSSYTTPPTAPGDTLDLSSDSRFLELRSYVDNVGSTETTDPSNTTAAILQALQVLDNSGSPAGALKVIVVLTDGQSPVLPDQPALADLVRQLDTSYASLFVYQIDGNDVGLAELASNLSRGFSESVNVNPSTVLNPLYTLKSYFSFLANARNSTSKDFFFWQPPYQDYDYLGLIRTVAYPAISSTGNLVGVAAIDIQVSKVDPNIAPEVDHILNTTKVIYPPTISPDQILTLGALSNANESTLCNATTLGTKWTDAVCQLNASDAVVKYPEGLCCSLSGCIEDKGHLILTALWICLGVLACLGIAGWVFRAWWKKKTSKAKEQRPNPPIPSGGYLS